MQSVYQSRQLRSTLNTSTLQVRACVKNVIEAVHCVALGTQVASQVWACVKMHRSSPVRSALNTIYITGLDMCKACTEAVRCVAP